MTRESVLTIVIEKREKMERNELKGRSNPVASCLYLDVDVDVVFPRFEKRKDP